MQTGPKGQERPADEIGAAVMVARLSIGDGAEALIQSAGRAVRWA